MTVADYEIVRKLKEMEICLRHIFKGPIRSIDTEAMEDKGSFTTNER